MASYFILISVIISIASLVLTIVMIYKFFRLCNAVDRIANAVAPEYQIPPTDLQQLARANKRQNSTEMIITIIAIIRVVLVLLSVFS